MYSRTAKVRYFTRLDASGVGEFLEPGTLRGSSIRRALCQTSVLLLGLIGTANSPAQVIPGAIAPGQIEKQIKSLPAPKSERLDLNIKPEEPIPEKEAQGTPFPLRDVQIEGANVYPANDLKSAFASLIGKTITLNQARAAARNLTIRYRNDGYVLAQAIIPAQEIKEGVLKVRVVEGHIAEVHLSGEDANDSRGLIQDYIGQIKQSRPLQVKTLERYLLLLNDLPGINAYGSLASSKTEAGAADLIIEIHRRPFVADMGFTNRMTELLGTWRGDVLGESYNLTGWQDRTSARVLQSLEGKMTVVSFMEEIPITTEGTKLQFMFNQVWSNSSLFLTASPIGSSLDSKLSSMYLTLSHPFIRSRNSNLTVRMQLSGLDSRAWLREFNADVSNDRIRALRWGVSYDLADRLAGINIIDLELSQGLNGLGARAAGLQNLSRAAGKPEFTKVNLYMARLQSLFPQWSFLAAFNGQYTEDPLLVPEEFALGGDQFLRAYVPSEFIGDRGYAVKGELRYDVNPWPFMSNTFYGFFDYGQIFNVGGNRIIARDVSAMAAGFGMRVSTAYHMSGYIEAAYPIHPNAAFVPPDEFRIFGGVRFTY